MLRERKPFGIPEKHSGRLIPEEIVKDFGIKRRERSLYTPVIIHGTTPSQGIIWEVSARSIKLEDEEIVEYGKFHLERENKRRIRRYEVLNVAEGWIRNSHATEEVHSRHQEILVPPERKLEEVKGLLLVKAGPPTNIVRFPIRQ